MWWPFKKKKLYRVVWKHNMPEHTCKEIIKAADSYHAWRSVQREYAFPVSLASIEEL